MAKTRYINTRFWNDNYIAALSPIDRYLFLYFLTNEHTNIAGVYELPVRTILHETGVTQGVLEKAFKKFEGKIHYLNGWVYVKNFQKHQSTTSETVRKGITSEMERIPPQISEMIQGLDTLSGPIIYLNSNSNLNPNPNSNAPQGEYAEDFVSFWNKYPKKIGKGAAWKAWLGLPKIDPEKIISSVIEHHSRDPAWKRDDGQYIPHPATFLNQRRWEDEIEESASQHIVKFTK